MNCNPEFQLFFVGSYVDVGEVVGFEVLLAGLLSIQAFEIVGDDVGGSLINNYPACAGVGVVAVVDHA